MDAQLREKIEGRTACIGVIGLGYVGLPLAVEFANEDLAGVRDRFTATSVFSKLDEPDAICICVPTPLRKTKDPDISIIIEATEEIGKRIRAGQLVILESTTYPGTTEEVILPRLRESGLEVGRDFFLAFSPERVDPGNRRFGLRNTPKVVGGITPACTALARDLYASFVEKVIEVSSVAAAEMVKLLENTFRSVNIALVNEMAIMCGKLGIDVWEVIDAAGSKPFGFMPFYPGPGLGGHCIPIDPHYLSWKLRTLDYRARFIELASDVNGEMPRHVVILVGDALNRVRKAINGSRILVLGAAYKPDTNDDRESPALDVIDLLQARGADVEYHDPLVPRIRLRGGEMESVELTEQRLTEADCVVVVTNHTRLDMEWIVRHSRILVDTRNATRGIRAPEKIVKL